MNIPIAHSTESLVRFLQHIEHAPVPEKVTPDYLKEAGFVSGHDRELIHIFRLLGFVDKNSEPTERWTQYREVGDTILQAAIHESYLSLFELYPDSPYSRSDEALRLWFRPPVTGNSESSIVRAIRTFRKLCWLADMIPPAPRPNTTTLPAIPEVQPIMSAALPSATHSQSVNVIQIVPPNNSADYVKFFEALKKVFYG